MHFRYSFIFGVVALEFNDNANDKLMLDAFFKIFIKSIRLSITQVIHHLLIGSMYLMYILFFNR